jgi:hypothetical protein
MVHVFNSIIAEKYSVDKAIILQLFAFWLNKMSANEENQFDGRTWINISSRALRKLFPYWGSQKIQRELNSIITEDLLLIRGHYSANKWDKTSWFAFKEEKEWLGVVSADNSDLNDRVSGSEQPRARTFRNTINLDKLTNVSINNHCAKDSIHYDGPQEVEWITEIYDIIAEYRKTRFSLVNSISTSKLDLKCVTTCLRKHGLDNCKLVAHSYFAKADISYMRPSNGFRITKFESKLQSALDVKEGKTDGNTTTSKPVSKTRQDKSKDFLREQGLKF